MRHPSSLLLTAVVLVGSLPACVGRPDHPVVRTSPGTPLAPNTVAAAAPEPDDLTAAAAQSILFAGLADVDAPLVLLRRRAGPQGSSPRLVPLPAMERAVLRRYARGGPLGPVRNATAFGYSAWSPLPPAPMADLLLDPVVEKAVLAADGLTELAHAIPAPFMSIRRFRLEMLRRGQGPVRFDFRVTSQTERWDLPDGTVLMRHEPHPVPPAQGITLYRGVTIVEPAAGGSHVTEFLVVGTSLAVPFFLDGAMRSLSLKTFQDRVTNLWIRAGWAASGRSPGGR